ncbi:MULTISPECIES: RrF2 family transcriptional regulator [Gracilibacillus]|uniref:RrF2 family transcriptional regulator n=1 Tax=Gracilibacillus TaxID=74385 RepID=UPI000826DD48|nr:MULTISPECIES: Rrf2 family transcriptional regulator [Gracilibacillus]
MKFSKGTNYALHTMIYLASQNEKDTISLQELAEQRNVPPSYLSKMLTKLAKKGLVASYSGAYGGFRLGKSAKEISFLDITKAIEGDLPLFQGCDKDNGVECLVENIMKNAENEMDTYLANTSLQDVLNKVEKHDLVDSI